jgi:hypothetical protein
MIFHYKTLFSKKLRNSSLVIAVAATLIVPIMVQGAAKCRIETKTISKIEGKISGVRNLKTRTEQHLDKYRICIADLEAKINDNWTAVQSTYLYGPDMTENEACERAIASAKLEVLRTKAIEDLTSSQLMECYEGDRPKQTNTNVKNQGSVKPIPKMTNKEWNGYKRIDGFGKLPWLK